MKGAFGSYSERNGNLNVFERVRKRMAIKITPLRKAGLKLAEGQEPEAVMVGSYDSYYLYNKEKCAPINHKLKTGARSE